MDPIVERKLASDLFMARHRVERLRRQLTRAERSLELREAEVSAFKADGTVPKRRGVINEVTEQVVWQARRSGRLQRKTGLA